MFFITYLSVLPLKIKYHVHVYSARTPRCIALGLTSGEAGVKLVNCASANIWRNAKYLPLRGGVVDFPYIRPG